MNFFVLLLFVACLVSLALSDNKPIMVIEIFKHGASYPSASENDPFTFPINDRITLIGMRQQYNLGKLLGKKYPHLLTTSNPNSVYMRSLNSSKSIESTYAQMFGLFQGKSAQLPSAFPPAHALPPIEIDPMVVDQLVQELEKTSESIPNGFIPDTINSKFVDEDKILDINPNNCVYVRDSQAARDRSTLVSQVFTYFKESVDAINSLGYKVSNMKSLAHLGDVLSTMYLEGRNQELPEQIKYGSVLYNDSVFASQWYSTYLLTGDAEEMAIKSMNLLEAVSTLALESLQKSNTLKFAVFSGQDSTLLPLLGLYKIVNDSCLLENYKSQKLKTKLPYPDCVYPKDGSQLIYEVYQLDGLAHIRFLYNGKPFQVCTSSTSDSCDLAVFLQDKKSLVHGFTIWDFDSFCTLGYKEVHTVEIPESTLISLHVLSLATVINFGFVMALICHASLSKRKLIHTQEESSGNRMLREIRLVSDLYVDRVRAI